MAEPACLRRSFSNPSETIHEFQEGDLTRALGESISFGRYMSESLAWEKWSTFSHNRYLEEAEKYSKPGSVAKMKAYFEAHYSRIGAKKRAVEEQANNDTSSGEVQSTIGNLPSLDTESTLPNNSPSIYEGKEGSTAKKREVEEQANSDSSSGKPEVQSTIGDLSSLNTDSTLPNTCTSIYELPGKDDSNVELLSSVIISSCGSSTPIKELQSEEINIVESGVNVDVDTMGSLSEVQEHQCKDAEVNACINENFAEIKVNQCKNAPESYINVELGVNVDTIDSSPKVQEHQCKDAEVNVCITENFGEINVKRCKDAPESDIIVGSTEMKLPVKMEAEKAKSNSRIKQKSVDSSLKGSIKGNVSKLSSSLVRLATPVRPKGESSDTPNKRVIVKECNEKKKPTPKLLPKRESSDTPNKRMIVKESIEKKKPPPKLVHGSSNSDVNTMKKSSPASHKSGIGKVFTPLGKIIRDRFASSPVPSRASVNSISRHPSATPQSETRRSRIALEKSFAKSRTLDQKFQSPSAGKMNSSVPSSTTFSSFSFRTEERAAIRRELLQKRLEKEAENLQLPDKAKVKLKIDSRKSSQCVNTKANATLDIKSEILSDKTKKIAPTRTHLPKCVGKSASEVARGTCTQPPQRSSDSKLDAEKSKPIATLSRAFPPKKKTHENASPNII